MVESHLKVENSVFLLLKNRNGMAENSAFLLLKNKKGMVESHLNKIDFLKA